MRHTTPARAPDPRTAASYSSSQIKTRECNAEDDEDEFLDRYHSARSTTHGPAANNQGRSNSAGSSSKHAPSKKAAPKPAAVRSPPADGPVTASPSDKTGQPDTFRSKKRKRAENYHAVLAARAAKSQAKKEQALRAANRKAAAQTAAQRDPVCAPASQTSGRPPHLQSAPAPAPLSTKSNHGENRWPPAQKQEPSRPDQSRPDKADLPRAAPRPDTRPATSSPSIAASLTPLPSPPVFSRADQPSSQRSESKPRPAPQTEAPPSGLPPLPPPPREPPRPSVVRAEAARWSDLHSDSSRSSSSASASSSSNGVKSTSVSWIQRTTSSRTETVRSTVQRLEANQNNPVYPDDSHLPPLPPPSLPPPDAVKSSAVKSSGTTSVTTSHSASATASVHVSKPGPNAQKVSVTIKDSIELRPGTPKREDKPAQATSAPSSAASAAKPEQETVKPKAEPSVSVKTQPEVDNPTAIPVVAKADSASKPPVLATSKPTTKESVSTQSQTPAKSVASTSATPKPEILPTPKASGNKSKTSLPGTAPSFTSKASTPKASAVTPAQESKPSSTISASSRSTGETASKTVDSQLVSSKHTVSHSIVVKSAPAQADSKPSVASPVTPKTSLQPQPSSSNLSQSLPKSMKRQLAIPQDSDKSQAILVDKAKSTPMASSHRPSGSTSKIKTRPQSLSSAHANSPSPSLGSRKLASKHPMNLQAVARRGLPKANSPDHVSSSPSPISATFPSNKHRASSVSSIAAGRKNNKAGRDVNGRSMLQRVCEKGRYDEALDLIKDGVDVNDKDYAGNTPLHEAALNGHEDIVKLLLDNGADIDIRSGTNDLDTPLIDAAANYNTETVKILLEYGADPCCRNFQGKTALDHVNESDSEAETLRDILKNATVKFRSKKPSSGVKSVSNGSAKGSHKRAALSSEEGFTSEASDSRNSKELRRRGTRSQHTRNDLLWIDATTRSGRDQVYKRAADGDTEYVGRFLEGGWEPDAECLCLAGRRGHLDVVELLLAFGAPVNGLNSDDETVLLQVSGRGHLDIIQLLLKNGADPCIKNRDGKTCAEIAQEALGIEDEEVVLLKEACRKSLHNSGPATDLSSSIRQKNSSKRKSFPDSKRGEEPQRQGISVKSEYDERPGKLLRREKTDGSVRKKRTHREKQSGSDSEASSPRPPRRRRLIQKRESSKLTSDDDIDIHDDHIPLRSPKGSTDQREHENILFSSAASSPLTSPPLVIRTPSFERAEYFENERDSVSASTRRNSAGNDSSAGDTPEKAISEETTECEEAGMTSDLSEAGSDFVRDTKRPRHEEQIEKIVSDHSRKRSESRKSSRKHEDNVEHMLKSLTPILSELSKKNEAEELLSQESAQRSPSPKPADHRDSLSTLSTTTQLSDGRQAHSTASSMSPQHTETAVGLVAVPPTNDKLPAAAPPATDTATTDAVSPGKDSAVGSEQERPPVPVFRLGPMEIVQPMREPLHQLFAFKQERQILERYGPLYTIKTMTPPSVLGRTVTVWVVDIQIELMLDACTRLVHRYPHLRTRVVSDAEKHRLWSPFAPLLSRNSHMNSIGSALTILEEQQLDKERFMSTEVRYFRLDDVKRLVAADYPDLSADFESVSTVRFDPTFSLVPASPLLPKKCPAKPHFSAVISQKLPWAVGLRELD
ncbi:uncharacterized protein V1510DRAFT_416403 [Dipodascopsis tothii]|uniref:uncharacterized protein n=1 Tax=Dipodascopsis tothii TaxID=44089 RepID=UPI0034CE3FED